MSGCGYTDSLFNCNLSSFVAALHTLAAVNTHKNITKIHPVVWCQSS